MSTKWDSGLQLLRVLISVLLVVAGVLAVKAVDSIAATEVVIENTVIGGKDALPASTKLVLKWQNQLRTLTILVCAGGLCGVWLLRKTGGILTVGLLAALLLLLEPLAIRYILDKAFVPVRFPRLPLNWKNP